MLNSVVHMPIGFMNSVCIGRRIKAILNFISALDLKSDLINLFFSDLLK